MKFSPSAGTGLFVLCLGAMPFGGRGRMWDVMDARTRSASWRGGGTDTIAQGNSVRI